MSNGDALQQAKTQLSELVEAARKGAIIPVRLPGQLEAIQTLLQQAEEQQAAALAEAKKNTGAGDAETILKENAQFFSVAVHELRTPVTSIRGYSDMLNTPSMGELTDMQKQFLSVIRTNTKRMESLLSDVSYINKLRAGTLRANAKMDMFKNIAMMVEKNAKPLVEELKRKLEFDTPQGLPLLNIDGDMLSAALMKLIENGLRYSPEESGCVKVSGKADGSTLIITVEDNGIGMTPEEVKQLGTLYFRSENDVVRNYKGSGLGIPIAFGIVKLLGGAINVESQPGQGTRFIITLKGMS
jgi:signal transduction histidine kinase